MKTITVSQYSRPLRIAFLVNQSTYIEAAKTNTALWGGILNPLVPVKVSTTAAERKQTLDMLADFDPDLIVNTTKYSYPYIEAAYPNNFIRKKIIRLSALTGPKFNGTKKELKFGIPLTPVLNDVWKETKFLTGNSNFALLKNTKYPDWDNLITILLGAYPDKEPLDFLEDYKAVLKPKEIEFKPDIIDKNNLYDIGSPIWLTPHGLEDYGSNSHSMSSHVIYLGNVTNWKDLVEFWNLRALGISIIYLPYENFKDFKKSVSRHMERGSYQINPKVRNNVTLLSGYDIKSDQQREVAEWISNDCKKPGVVSGDFRPVWNRKQKLIVPDVTRREYRTAEKEEVVSFNDSRITPFYLAAPDILAKYRGWKEMAWATVIQFSGYYRSKFCFSFPVDPKVEDVLAHSLTQIGELRLSPEGIVIARKYNKETVYGSPVETFKVVEALFKSAGASISMSQPGVIAQNLINFLGEIEGCRLLKVDGIRRAVRELNRRGALDARAVTQIIGQNWHADDNDDLVLQSGQNGSLNAGLAFDALVKSKLIKPGLKFRCEQCKQEDWYPVGDFTEKYKCNFCFLNQDVPRLDKLEWTYTTSGLITTQDEGYGSLPVILALWRLNHMDMARNAQGMTSIQIVGKNINQEIDFVHLITEQEGGYKLVIGEAKGLNTLTDRDVAKMRKVAEMFKDPPYIAFVTLKDQLNQQEKDRIKRLVNKGFSVIVLTRNDLEPYDLFKRFASTPHKYAHSLSDLAENTQQLNL